VPWPKIPLSYQKPTKTKPPQYTKFDIAEIAYQLNFSDPANFGKFFKKHSGFTPLEYRKQGFAFES